MDTETPKLPATEDLRIAVCPACDRYPRVISRTTGECIDRKRCALLAARRRDRTNRKAKA